MTTNNNSNIQPGDLVTLKGMKNLRDKPIGMVQKKWATDHIEIFWLNERMAKRYAVHKILSHSKLEVISNDASADDVSTVLFTGRTYQ